MNFKEYSFSDLLSNIVDNRGRTCPVEEDGMPLIATNCIKNDSLYPVYEKIRFVSDETYQNWFRGHPEPGDLIFVCKGSPGRVALVPNPVPFCIAQDMVAIRADKDVIDPKFLFALLRSSETQEKIGNMHVGTIIPHFKKGDFKNLYLTIPEDKEYQKQVGEIYCNFSLKIENNTQINQTLEAMAQAMFKSWFVDFDPVKAKMEARASGGSDDAVRRAAMAVISGKSAEELVKFEQENPEAFAQLAATADLFPEAMVESELGLIPEGWEVTTFGEVSACYDRMRIPLSNREREGKKGDIPYYGATSVMDYVNEALFDDIYLLLGEDGSVLKPDGTPFIQYIWGKAWVNNHAHVLQGRNGVSTEHLMVFISTQNITAYVTGAVQLKLNQKNMNSIPFVKADIVINNSFAEKLHALFSIVRSNFDETKELIQTRDLLLPKLLSGEIDLTNFGEVNA